MGAIAQQADIDQLEAHGLPPLPESTYALIEQASERYSDRPALSFFLTMDRHHTPQRWSYRQWMEKIRQTANFFRSLGVHREDCIAFVLPNLPQTHWTLWGGQAAGRVAALNPLLESEALEQLIQQTGAKVLVTVAPFPGSDLWEKIAPCLERLNSLEHVVLVELSELVQGIKKIPARYMQAKAKVNTFGWPTGFKAPAHRVRMHSFDASIRRYPGERLMFEDRPTRTDVSSCFCTGGTTGLPKIALRTHGNEVFNAWSAGAFFGDGISSEKNIMCGLPLFHVNGVLVTGLLPFSKGAHVVLAGPMGYRTPGLIPRFWEVVERHRIHFFSGVPTLYSALLEVPVKHHNISTLEYGLCGAAPMPAETMKGFQSLTGIKILEGYGLTEGTCVSSVNPPFGERRLGSIGMRIPFQSMKAVVLDERGQYLRDCNTDEIGALLIAGPNVFKGYLNPEQNKGLWVDCGDQAPWLNTGDLGRVDAQGYFYLTGRKKELIIRGGHNIDPKMIEDALAKHPCVQLCAAVGRPDKHAGELPVAYVQLRAGQSASPEELLAFAYSNIPERAAVPKAVHVLESMPLTGVGKIFKPDLKKKEIISSVFECLGHAGIAARSVDVKEDKTLGQVVQVALEQASAHQKAQEVLGQLALRFDLVED